MKTYLKLFFALTAGFTFSCGQQELDLEAKKEQLTAYKNEVQDLRAKIKNLENEIAQEDPVFALNNRKSVLVTTTKAQKEHFKHYVEVTGSVLSKMNVNISAEVSGRIEEINALEGMQVRKGQVLAKVDAETINNNIEEVETQLELATILYNKQKRLWDQEIGTEVQFLEAKNRMETLENNLASLKTRKDKTSIIAPFNGTVEDVMVRVGELVQPGMPMFNFVGDSKLYIEGDISETYVGVLGQGDSVNVEFPSIEKNLKTKVTAVGAVINPDNRTFKVEVFLPNLKEVKPNMISVLKIKDYENEKAVTVPANLIQRDNRGDFVYVVENNQAKKKYITRGKTYHRTAEVTKGLDGDELLVDKGFREVGEGFNVEIVQE
ncbi:efflux RND transporter periplasmic adaptor subunit [Echinicola jeungdonensis]|uniref:Efflux RND transporter periplasmic adaptor subunit n=1 Tax=Echinicola jeungdonensis TaxID=709343 RepID=A0ABV5J2S3_9BACT|nr:efflux RND transporter periplasmic adaptor subunit [Echinicola jeungdonensis]MDN3668146.1 efflux RND transporter periplasmic adaptor subunit [Echinicola jeungdonensis]